MTPITRLSPVTPFTPSIDWRDPHSVRKFVQSLDAPMYAPCMVEVEEGLWAIACVQ